MSEALVLCRFLQNMESFQCVDGSIIPETQEGDLVPLPVDHAGVLAEKGAVEILSSVDKMKSLAEFEQRHPDFFPVGYPVEQKLIYNEKIEAKNKDNKTRQKEKFKNLDDTVEQKQRERADDKKQQELKGIIVLPGCHNDGSICGYAGMTECPGNCAQRKKSKEAQL